MEILKLKDDANNEHAFRVKAIDGQPGAYQLLDEQGKPMTLSYSNTTDGHMSIIYYDGLWVENEYVTSLNLMDGSKRINMGKLIND